jgi:hypothetical protein
VFTRPVVSSMFGVKVGVDTDGRCEGQWSIVDLMMTAVPSPLSVNLSVL